MSAGHGEDAAGIVLLGIGLLLTFVSCVPGLFAGVKGILRDRGSEFSWCLLPGCGYAFSSAVDLLFGDEVLGAVRNWPVAGSSEVPVAEAPVCS